jgi:hypothetical protein
MASYGESAGGDSMMSATHQKTLPVQTRAAVNGTKTAKL